MEKIILATNNAGKIKEYQHLLSKLAYKIIPQTEYDIPEVDETGLTFIENAIIKARHAAKHSGLAAIADDSGLCIDALHGKPGIHSARFSGKSKDMTANIAKVLEQLKDTPTEQRQAQFQCVIAFLRSPEDPTPIVCQANWQGVILEKPQGEGGFGYDPIFYVPSHQCSAAELNLAEKSRISHRGQALQQLISCMKCHKLDDAVL